VQKNTKKPQKEKSARETIGNDFDEEVVDKFPEVLPWNLPAPDSEKNGEKDSEKYRAVLVNADDEKVKETEEKEKKPKIAIVSLTSCEGCQFALLDLGEKFMEAMEKVDMVDFRLIEDEEDSGEKLDIGFVEGNPMTKANKKTLKALRKRSKLLVVLGNCAAMGGVPEIKNYQEQKNTAKHVYKYIRGIDNVEIQEVDNFVKVDFTFPGCPITGEEFLEYFPMLLESAKTGKSLPELADKPVCVECKAKGNRCMLLDKKPCFGPMIQGGCDAVCPSAGMMCQGCRGLRPKGNIKAMRATLKNMMTDEEFENVTEIYGLRDDIFEREYKLDSK
jgi:coenzyme F420-reducing hydrogenase gamma subunit